MSGATEETARGANQVTIPIALLSGTEATSPAAAGYVTSTPVAGFAKCQWITVLATIKGATGGTLDVILEHSPDGNDWYEFVHFAQLAAAAAETTISWEPGDGGQFIAVGKNKTTTTVLAAGASAGRLWFDRFRIRFVAGASTSAGAVQSVTVIGAYRGR